MKKFLIILLFLTASVQANTTKMTPDELTLFSDAPLTKQEAFMIVSNVMNTSRNLNNRDPSFLNRIMENLGYYPITHIQKIQHLNMCDSVTPCERHKY